MGFGRRYRRASARRGHAVVYVEQAQRRISAVRQAYDRSPPVRRDDVHPLKINMAGVIPVISPPRSWLRIVAQFGSLRDAWVQWISGHFLGQHVLPDDLLPYDPLFFAFFYSDCINRVADNMKRYPGYPRVSCGSLQPVRYVINRITSLAPST